MKRNREERQCLDWDLELNQVQHPWSSFGKVYIIFLTPTAWLSRMKLYAGVIVRIWQLAVILREDYLHQLTSTSYRCSKNWSNSTGRTSNQFRLAQSWYRMICFISVISASISAVLPFLSVASFPPFPSHFCHYINQYFIFLVRHNIFFYVISTNFVISFLTSAIFPRLSILLILSFLSAMSFFPFQSLISPILSLWLSNK